MSVVRSLITLLGFDVDDKEAKRYESLIDGLKTGAMVAGAAITALGGYLLKVAGDAEQTQAAFETMLGSQKAAADMIKEIQKAAAITPYSQKDLIEGAKLLLNFGVAQKDVLADLMMLGDVSSGDAVKLQSMTLAFAQISATGRLMGQDLLQLINAGFNPLQEISRTSGKSIGVLKKEMEKGAISFDMVKEAFRTSTSQGGRFFQMMQKQSETFNGRMSTVQDNMEQLAVTIGQHLLPVAKQLLEATANFVDASKDLITTGLVGLFEGIGRVAGEAFTMVSALFKGVGGFDILVKTILAALNMVGDLVKAIATMLNPLLEGIGKIIRPVLDILTMLFQKIGYFVGSVLRPFNSIFESIGRIFGWFGKVVADLMPIIELVANALGTKFRMQIEALLIPFKLMMAIVEPILNGLMQLADIILKALVPGLDASNNGFDSFNQLLDKVYPLIDGLIDLLRGFVKMIVDGVVWALNLLTPVLRAVSEGFGWVLNAVSGLTDSLKGLMGWILDAVTGLRTLLGLKEEAAQPSKPITKAEMNAISPGITSKPRTIQTPKAFSDMTQAELTSSGFGMAPHYQQGTNYVPEDQLAFLHKAEKVIPAGAPYSGGGGTSLQINAPISITVPPGTSQSQAEFVKEAARQAVQVELTNLMSTTINSNPRAAY